MPDTYDSQEVSDILSDALGSSAPQQSEDIGHSALSFGDMTVFSSLYEILSKYLHSADLQVVMDELRQDLHAGFTGTSLKNLHSLSLNCRKCPNLTHPASLPSWNLKDPDILFVMESPSLSQDDFDYLITCAKEAGLRSRNLALTYLNRCSSPSGKYTDVENQNCFGFLASEIEILKPKLVLGFGLSVACSLLHSPVKLGEERGKVIWMGPWAVICTWAPGYALRSKGVAAEQFRMDIATAFQYVYGRDG